MTTQGLSRLLLLTVCLMFSAACERKASEEIDAGTIRDSVYRNNYFGLTLKLPPAWSVQDQAARQRLVEVGAKVMAGEDKSMKAILKAAEPQTVHLLQAFEHPVGSPVDFNPSIMCTAERVREQPGIKQGKDYLFHVRKLMEAGQLQFSVPQEGSPPTVKLGGVDFDFMPAVLTIGTKTVKQKYYVTISKGYALIFILSYSDEKQDSFLHGILGTLSLDPKKTAAK